MSESQDIRWKKSKNQANIEFYNLVYLAQKYGIDMKYENGWIELLLALARDKVKGFSEEVIKPKKVGRPPKDIKDKLPNFFMRKRRPGAPIKPKVNPAWFDNIKTLHGLSGHGSDKKAIEILVKKDGKRRYRESDIKYFQKRLSDARKINKS